MKTSSKFGPREYIFIGMLFVIPVVMSMCVLSPRSKANAQMRDDSAVKRRQLGEFTLIRERAMQQVNDNIVELEKAVFKIACRSWPISRRPLAICRRWPGPTACGQRISGPCLLRCNGNQSGQPY